MLIFKLSIQYLFSVKQPIIAGIDDFRNHSGQKAIMIELIIK